MRKGSTLRNRIFRLRFPHDDGPRAQLLPNKLGATEYLSREFECSIELLSDNPNIALKEMQGKPFKADPNITNGRRGGGGGL